MQVAAEDKQNASSSEAQGVPTGVCVIRRVEMRGNDMYVYENLYHACCSCSISRVPSKREQTYTWSSKPTQCSTREILSSLSIELNEQGGNTKRVGGSESIIKGQHNTQNKTLAARTSRPIESTTTTKKLRGRTYLYPSVHPFQERFGGIHPLVNAAVVLHELCLRHLRALLLVQRNFARKRNERTRRRRGARTARASA